MIKIPRFFYSKKHFKQFIAKLKLVPCPHCKKIGFLIRNGRLMGNDVKKQNNCKVKRAQRFFVPIEAIKRVADVRFQFLKKISSPVSASMPRSSHYF